MKKLLLLILTVSLLFCFTACGGSETPSNEVTTQGYTENPVSALIKNATLQYPASNDLFKYNVYDTYVEITEYIGQNDAKKVVVPATLEDLPVYVVGTNTFDKDCDVSEIVFEDGIYNIKCEFVLNTTLKKVVLPSSLSGITYGMFENCYGLETVVIPEGIERINTKAFMSCSSLEEITLPSTIKYIDTEAFAFCTSLEKINLPEGLVEIYDRAFLSCENLESIELPSTLEKIGNAAFQGTGLRTIVLPETLKTVCGSLFTACESLETVEVLNKDLEIVPEKGYNFALLFSQCDPELVVRGKAGSTIANQCARENIFFEVIQ